MPDTPPADAFGFRLPAWLAAEQARDAVFVDPEARMRSVIALAHRNIDEKTGGPFAAAIFDPASGRRLSVGVNLVPSEQCSVLHAEIVAILLAQRRLGAWNLAEVGALELVTSCEPCAMCFGAIPWSGVRKVCCAASDQDARDIGFDEGPKVADWAAALEARGITVEQGRQRTAARGVFTAYAAQGGLIYNAGD